MSNWATSRWFQRTMLISGVAIWLFNAWRLIVSLQRMELLEALAAGMFFVILPPLLWRDWKKETK